MIHFQKQHWLTIMIGIFLIFTVGILYYFTSFSTLKVHNFTLEKQLTNVKSDQTTEIDMEKLQQDLSDLVVKVPVEKLVDSIILDLEGAAVGSDSIILNAAFSDVQKEEQPVSPAEDTSITEQPTEEQSYDLDNENGELLPLEEVVVITPDGLEAISISLTVLSKDFDALTKFLENIRKNPRIYVVESFSFQGYEEGEVLPGPQEDQLEYSVVLSTYYAPVITGVANKFGLVIPPISNKNNPIYDVLEERQAPSIEETPLNETETETEVEVEEFTEDVSVQGEPEKPSIKTYKVQPGDTLYSISMKFYRSRTGESIIKKANKLKSDMVIIGETLLIP
ncbi:LysM peptidoglycan-binding domain-containing protein [Psychrobacillus sp. INOP01]|uniref:LysM peptidoglycan-binding domain-containing protein n=1 Tax=Psychrobacillus sp. INOP01 TaxID=2829187 RepID=UPI001BAAA51D|nr:LysM peptidoglycan-binding domain-containing protein [Psychrobacillus sp. INOP01]QUG42237.1 LysM peptidoglycan-binding domain-containing protein [Psychrobacillus sp. INOP01]